MTVSSPAAQIDWVKQHILDQVDAIVDNFTMNDPVKLLQCSKVIVASVVDKIDIKHALDMYYHIMATVDAVSAPQDRLQCVYDHFNDWIELELAKRYA
ncbi:MAG: hypothetical protein EBU08_22000 [Micrococcales bacterium]|nr:hypothetical protein [Micrococcales bacterium]